MTSAIRYAASRTTAAATGPSPQPPDCRPRPSTACAPAAASPPLPPNEPCPTVTSSTLRRARIDAGGSRLRLRALHVMGHGSARIARALGVREMTIRAIVRGDTPTVSARLRDAITDLYDAWWDKRAPERTRFERAAATAARRNAIAGNWCAGAGLDDDELDTPGYRPASGWKPATGTGIAPDIHPPARPRQPRKNT